MKRCALLALAVVVLVLATTAAYAADPATGYTLVGWNNLGMHCMDADFQVFTIRPPYNVIHAQLVDANGHFVANGASYVVTYQAVADPRGSVNSSSVGKTNFWQFVGPLFGATPAPDMGLAGYGMPGPGNVPQTMSYDPAMRWWIADGIPITPVNDRGSKDTYPMMRLVARDLSGTFLAQTDIVLPVSDEMDCRACHASGSGPDARPSGGWINHADPQLDFRYNVLLLHDDYQGGSPRFQQALADAGYDPDGLYATAHDRGTPILCAKCHASNALPGTGMAGIPPLTNAVHSLHASVNDPTNQKSLDDSTNRSACYRCHPGSTTRCLRGAMGKAVAGDGTMAMQCQGCHGSMSAVGSASRVGWLDQPSCQNCHSGTAVHNNGQIRYTSALEADGSRRQAVDATFATNPDVPGVGYSLYRFSFGHGGLACESCHGATHAEYASFEANDNVQSQQLQGHAGTISDCSTCHAVTPSGSSGGPHGMHPVGQAWVEAHGDAAEDGGSAACQGCHGSDSRGTVLSYALGPRTLNTEFGTKNFWQGFQVSCYACHNGPNSESANPNRPPVASDLNKSAKPDGATPITLTASDADGNALTYRIVSQPQHGTVGLSGSVATYFADAGYKGADSFTYAAWDGMINSNLAKTSLDVSDAPPPSPPVAPSSLTAKAGATGSGSTRKTYVDLRWRDNSNNEAAFVVERCQGRRCTNFAPIATTAANATTYRDGTTASRTTYRFRVKARNAGGDSKYSNVVSATTP
jgi:hypothetical protein